MTKLLKRKVMITKIRKIIAGLFLLAMAILQAFWVVIAIYGYLQWWQGVISFAASYFCFYVIMDNIATA